VDAAVLCRNCSWFGVYREDVTDRIRGCPICGSPDLTVRDADEQRFSELGRRLLEAEDDAER
jgi:Zn finger protein HypA/HybF involved in hydrogenase expression